MSKNALQAVLDRASQVTPQVAPPPARSAPPRPAKPQTVVTEAAEVADAPAGFYRPSREGKQLIAGHFPKGVAKQLKLLSVEEDTTVQELLAEALDMLFVKKGRARIADITGRARQD